MPAVLFVCTANICRSPMASAIFEAIVQEKGEEQSWKVESAGTWAAEGQPAAAGSQLAMESKGLDTSKHRSRRIKRELLESFDLILTMERSHKEALQFEFPDLADRIYLLSEMVDRISDVPDPIGGAYAEYEKTANVIDQILLDGFNRIQELASKAESE